MLVCSVVDASEDDHARLIRIVGGIIHRVAANANTKRETGPRPNVGKVVDDSRRNGRGVFADFTYSSEMTHRVEARRRTIYIEMAGLYAYAKEIGVYNVLTGVVKR